MAHTEDGTPLLTGPDTMSDVTIVSPRVVRPQWKTRPLADPVHVAGVGGQTPAATEVLIPVRLQWGMPVVLVAALVGPLPPGIDGPPGSEDAGRA